MAMQLRILEESQIDSKLDAAIKKNLVECYPDNRDDFSKSRAYHGNVPSYSVVLQNGEVICAHAAVMDRLISVGGQQLHIAGIGNVAVLPEYRGKALSSEVLNLAMEEACRRGFDFGLLFTSEPVRRVYSRCGWEVATDRKVIKTEDGQVTQMPDWVLKMYYPLQGRPFPPGVINLQGKDW